MKVEHVKYLVCPKCKTDLTLESAETPTGSIETGELICQTCKGRYPIIRRIPRFVPLDNYSSSFGFEWTKHARTQYDSYSGTTISQSRFFEETKWPRRMDGELLLEVGSGSGRFTEQAASTGAMVISLDYSFAVEANYSSNGRRSNVLIVQGDVYEMPFREGSFDKVVCIGVIQHTPDPEKSFLALPRYLKPGGRLAVDVYRRNDGFRGWLDNFLDTKHFVRSFTRRMSAETLYRCVEGYINLMWPIATAINKIPKVGRSINWRLMVADFRGVFPLSEPMLKEWAILDTFDMLSPKFDFPQTIDTVQAWFANAGLTDIEVHAGFNGIEGRGRKPR